MTLKEYILTFITTNMNQTHKDIKFNTTYENNGQINVLDLLIIRKPTKIENDVFRKPNTTDKTINFFSNHPIEHKKAAFRYCITRMHSLPLTSKRKQKEWTTIQNIAQNNAYNFPYTLIQELNFQLQHGHNNYDRNNNSDRNRKRTLDNYIPITLLPQASHTGTKHRRKQPNIPTDLRLPHITSPHAIYTEQYSDTSTS
jgi:hypothetical protein